MESYRCWEPAGIVAFMGNVPPPDVNGDVVELARELKHDI
jgi:hypothetical protein